MKSFFVWTVIMLGYCQSSWAIYGPSLKRADVSVAARACQQAHFDEGQQIVKAMEGGRSEDIQPVLGDALRELKATSERSGQFAELYAARAFCVHELVPARLPLGGPIGTPAGRRETDAVKRFRDLGIEYFYYDSDAVWTLRKDPVDLNLLAKDFLNTEWGREAFLMMTELGWSQGACQEGPDQFRQVIMRGEAFLSEYPNSEVSDRIRLEMANAYATWWNISRQKPGAPDHAERYVAGSVEAKRKAIELYEQYLKSPKADDADARERLRLLQQNPKGSEKYDYWCPEYDD
jgi:hypothetical protein